MLVFETDFGRKETSVSAMYGVVKSVDRNIEIIEATHELPPFDIYTASYRLWQAMEYWPAGTVFVSVVDPGVGTKRRACVALTEDGYYIVTPDNGSLTHVRRTHGIAAVREIDETINRRRGSEGTAVFHGRDLFGYCAARLTSGIITFEQVGPSYSPDEIVMLDIPSFHADEGRAEGLALLKSMIPISATSLPTFRFRTCWIMASAMAMLSILSLKTKAARSMKQICRWNLPSEQYQKDSRCSTTTNS